MSATSFETLIAAHAWRAHPFEACGLVLRDPTGQFLEVQETENRAKDPAEFFEMDPVAFLEAKKTGRLVGYYHSHPHGGHELSEPDKANAHEVGLPCFVFGCATKRLNVHVPETFPAPILGRPFTPMVFDCVSLVWDYFRKELRRPLPYFPRTQADYSHGTDFDFRALIKAEGATVEAHPRAFDVLVFTLHGSTRPNHLGVLMPNGNFLHQTRDGSRYDVLGGFWRMRMVYAVRVPGIHAEGAQ